MNLLFQGVDGLRFVISHLLPSEKRDLQARGEEGRRKEKLMPLLLFKDLFER